MIVDVAQRHRARSTVFIPPDDRFNPILHEVAEIPDDTTARAFVEREHYSGSYPAARERYGLWFRDQLVGVAVYSHPANDLTLKRLPCDRLEGVELGRLVLLDSAAFNSETWFIARTFERLRRAGYRGVVSFSDPAARSDESGAVVFKGHVGQIYQASNAVFTGVSAARTQRLRRNGQVLSARAISKIRSRDVGWRYSAALLERDGADPLGEREDSRAWLAKWLPRLTRTFRHPGNLTYLFGLDAATKRRLPRSLAYPRIKVAA